VVALVPHLKLLCVLVWQPLPLQVEVPFGPKMPS
jgi:hypothetical protein